jgi:hypothetical protein
MAGKANVNRKRILRSAILTASMLSLIPLIGVMQSTAAKTDGGVMAATTSAGEPLPATPATQSVSTASPAAATGSTATAPAATTTASSAAKQTTATSQTTSATSYTRTKAS